MTRTALYRHWSGDGSLLWVGIAACPIRRLGTHSVASPWFGEISSITVEWHPSRAEALAAETRAILRERPRFNVKASQRGHRRPHGKHREWPTGLGRWLMDNGVTLSDFAARVGAGPSHMSQIAQGKSTPGTALALCIERETRGAVPASSWAAPEAIAAE